MSDEPDQELEEYQPSGDPIIGLTERERRFGEAYFEVALQHGDSSNSLFLAYRRAFPLADNSDHSATMLARHLIKSPNVLALVARLRESLASRALVPASRVIIELERLAFSNILDYMTLDPNTGDPTVDVRRLTPATASAVAEIVVDETYDPRTEKTHRKLRFKFHDKLSAIDKLARVHGLYQEFDNPNFSLEVLDRLIRKMEQKLIEKGLTIDHQAAE